MAYGICLQTKASTGLERGSCEEEFRALKICFQHAVRVKMGTNREAASMMLMPQRRHAGRSIWEGSERSSCTRYSWWLLDKPREVHTKRVGKARVTASLPLFVFVLTRPNLQPPRHLFRWHLPCRRRVWRLLDDNSGWDVYRTMADSLKGGA